MTDLVLAQRDTELDDEIEQILFWFVPNGTDRVRARNMVCSAIAARGFDVYARPTAKETT